MKFITALYLGIFAAFVWADSSAPIAASPNQPDFAVPGTQEDHDRNPLDQGADNCPATVIASLPYTDSGNTTGMAHNFSPTCVPPSSGPDVIYTYTAAASGYYFASTCGSGINTVLEVRRDGACPGTSLVNCNNDSCGEQSALTFLGIAGVQYYFIVEGRFSASFGPYTLNVSFLGPQGTDVCPATVISSLPYTNSGTTTGAQNNFETAASCATSAGPDVIYRYTATANGYLHVSLCGSSFRTVLVVRRGSVCPGNVVIECNEYYCNAQSAITFITDADSTYYFVVDSWHGGAEFEGNYIINVSRPCDVQQQPGDIVECAEAIGPAHQANDCNGGCTSYPYNGSQRLHTTIQTDQTVFGRGFNYQPPGGGFAGDADWYQFSLVESCSVSVEITAEFSPAIDLYTFSHLVNGCGTNALHYVQSLVGSQCATFFASYSEPQPPGYYLFNVRQRLVTGATGVPWDYRVTLHVMPLNDCVITCQPGDIVECPEPADTSMLRFDCDGACGNLLFGGPENVVNINTGQTICGRMFLYPGPPDFPGWQNDRDYFRFTITEPCTVRATAVSEVPLRVGIYQPCWGFSLNSMVLQPCQSPQVLTVPIALPGTYDLYVIGEIVTAIPGRDLYRLTFETFPCGGSCLPPDSLTLKVVEPDLYMWSLYLPQTSTLTVYYSTDINAVFPTSYIPLITAPNLPAGQYSDEFFSSSATMRFVAVAECGPASASAAPTSPALRLIK